METVTKDGVTYAIILRKDVQTDSIKFFTDSTNPFQLGLMNRPAGYTIPSHIHRPTERVVREVQEALFVTEGRVEAEFFTEKGEAIGKREFGTGDVVLLMRGGHGFKFLEPTRMVEVKQGPYGGKEADKKMIE